MLVVPTMPPRSRQVKQPSLSQWPMQNNEFTAIRYYSKNNNKRTCTLSLVRSFFKSAKVRVSMDVDYLFGVRGACVDISQMPGPVFITRAPTACDAWNRNKPIILIFISATGNRATCAQVCTRPSMYAVVPLHPPLLGEPSQRLNACFAGSVDRPVVGDSEVTTLAALW